MGVTHREVERALASLPVHVTIRAVTKVVPLLQWLLKLLPSRFRSRLANTRGGRSGAIYSLIERQRFAEAFHLAMEGVTYCEGHQTWDAMQALDWWIFMECAARSATQLGENERQQVLARLTRAPEHGGLLEAQCLVSFSSWRWALSDQDGALEFARRAVLADPTWAPGRITLAFYGLVTGKFDPLPMLREAVRLAPDSLETIRADPTFARFPDLIAALAKPGRK
jgi:hypothetical protein